MTGMASKIVVIDARQIRDWPSFHDVFAESLGFPSFYGRNMNAWIDCMTSVDDPEDHLTTVHAERGFLVLQLDHVTDFARRCPGIFDALVDCAAFVNWRRIQAGEEPVLALSFDKQRG